MNKTTMNTMNTTSLTKKEIKMVEKQLKKRLKISSSKTFEFCMHGVNTMEEILERIIMLSPTIKDSDDDRIVLEFLDENKTTPSITVKDITFRNSDGEIIPPIVTPKNTILVPKTMKSWFNNCTIYCNSLKINKNPAEFDDDAAKNMAAAFVAAAAKDYFNKVRFGTINNNDVPNTVNIVSSETTYAKTMFERLTLNLDKKALKSNIVRYAKKLASLDNESKTLLSRLESIIPKAIVSEYKSAKNKNKLYKKFHKKARAKIKAKYYNYNKIRLYFLFMDKTAAGAMNPTTDARTYKRLLDFCNKIILKKGVFDYNDKLELENLERAFSYYSF